MKVEICRPIELGRHLIDDWRSFQLSDPAFASPFLSPEFACAADRARLHVRVAVVYDGQTVVGFLPYTAGRFGVASPVAPGFCDQQALVHGADHACDLLGVLASAGLTAMRFDHLLAQGAPRPDPSTSLSDTCTWLVELPDGWGGYQRWGRANRKRHFNWMERKVRRFTVDYPDTTFTFDSADRRDLDALIRLKTRQCRSRGWEDVFAAPWRRQMVEELAVTRTETLAGTVSALRVGDRVVASDFSLRGSSVYAGWQIAYDPEYSRSSPGVVRWHWVLEAVAKDGPVTVDLGKGPDDFKVRFATSTLPLVEGVVSARPSGRAVVTGDRALSRTRQELPGLESALRRSVRRWRRHRYGETGRHLG